jgi:capsular polysaccharide transport system permease protein
MTTVPKAKKFRIRRTVPLLAPTQVAAAATAAANAPAPTPVSYFAEPEDGFGNQRFATAAPDTVLGPTAATPEDEISAIRAEGLSGRQLRMARRIAQKNGIEANSDFEAVRALRRRGIDPFEHASVLDFVTSSAARPATGLTSALARIDGPGADMRVQLPQTTRPGHGLPSTEVMTEDRRAREIVGMQRDIARRRRRRTLLLFTRLAFFVLLPAMMAGYYYYELATKLYATKTEFVIQQADQPAGGLGGLFSGTGMATSQDSITVQSYLQSRDAMLRLDHDHGFKAHFSQDNIDALQRLAPDATNERAYKLYRRNVKIGYDPTEGIVRMEVIAADPNVSEEFSRALISYAEEQVDQLTQRLREDQMKGARESYADAEAKVLAAQSRVLELQVQLGVLDPVTESSMIMQQVGTFEVQLQEKRLSLQQLLDNAQPNQARVDGVKGDIARLEQLIANLRSALTQGSGTTSSLAAVTGQLRIAEADLQTRQLMLSQAAQQLETARIEANKQVRYLSMGVNPVAPDEPTYPRAFENTVLAFLILGGIYLMLSLTASILREQVAA